MNPSTDRRAYTRAFYQGNRLNFALALLFTVLSTGAMLYLSWVLGEVTNLMAASDLDELGRTLSVTLISLAGILAVELLTYYYKSRFIHKAMRQYKDLAFSRLSEKSISAFSRETTSRYLSALTNDANSVEENYLNRSLLLIYHGALFVGGMTMMLAMSWQLALAAIVLCLIPIACALAMGGGLARRERAMSDQNERFVAQVKDFLSGFSIIKSFKAEGEVKQLFCATNAETERVKERRRRWEGMLSGATQVCGVLLQMGIFFIGAWLAITGSIQMGTVLVILNLCNCFTAPIQIVPQYWASRKAALALVDKLDQVTRENAGRSGRAIPPVLKQAIALEGVSFGYEEGRPVLQGLSIRFEPGKRYAVVGPSGSGKSTLLSLLMGAYHSYTGSITIDGQQLREVDPDSLYDLMSLIGQNVFLFDDTITRNLTLFRDFPAQQVEDAVQRSGLSALVEQRGADYRCGENGVGLSGGERQRVSIARALLRGTPVLLLDEATAALDNQTAYEVTDGILSLEGLTRIVVTHRLDAALMQRYDEILVLKDGRLLESGTFRELMQAKKYFYSLFTLSEG
ncbi:MAG TPA: ABC transporter ATP-binding protein [Candidatus Enterenecus merdae]|nr:ABC transporter ATP-binding protein [Candidatus Enterenecus merdae]